MKLQNYPYPPFLELQSFYWRIWCKGIKNQEVVTYEAQTHRLKDESGVQHVSDTDTQRTCFWF